MLDAAEALFSEKSFAAVGVREIADRAGVNLAMISYYFGSKNKLYLDCVRRALARRAANSAWSALHPPPKSKPAAAAAFVHFVHQFLAQLLSEAEHDTCCSFIMREASQPTAAIDFIVRDFIKPNEDTLKRVLQALRPDKSDAELRVITQSVLGQCLHYRVFQPFMERLRGRDLSSPKRLTAIADQIAEFSLRGLGLTEQAIARALASGKPAASELAIEGASHV